MHTYQSFWGTDFPIHFDGDPTKYGHFFSGNTIDPLVRDLLADRDAVQYSLNARQLFQTIRSQVLDFEDPSTTRCDLLPPERPNVYSDGGVQAPTNHSWSLGSFGLTWPQRCPEAKPFSDSENDFAFTQVGPNGLDLWGPIPGQRCSSTRAELTGGITSPMGPGPIHIGVGSQAFLDKAKGLHRKACIAVDAPEFPIALKHWSLVRDGDLWRVFWKVLLQKRPQAVAFSKVKGHSKMSEVQEGAVLLRDHLGNQRADANAHRGARANVPGLIQLSHLLTKHEKAYVELVGVIHQHLLDRHATILEASKAISIYDGSLPLRGPAKVLLNPQLSFPLPGEGRPLGYIWTPTMSSSAKAILVFLTSFIWVPAIGLTNRESHGSSCSLFSRSMAGIFANISMNTCLMLTRTPT